MYKYESFQDVVLTVLWSNDHLRATQCHWPIDSHQSNCTSNLPTSSPSLYSILAALQITQIKLLCRNHALHSHTRHPRLRQRCLYLNLSSFGCKEVIKRRTLHHGKLWLYCSFLPLFFRFLKLLAETVLWSCSVIFFLASM